MECTDPNACTLDSTALTQRLAEWREVSSQAITREVEADKITTTYPADAQLVQRLRDLVAAEAECCAFLTFAIHPEEHQTVVELTFPAEARSLVDLLSFQ